MPAQLLGLETGPLCSGESPGRPSPHCLCPQSAQQPGQKRQGGSHVGTHCRTPGRCPLRCCRESRASSECELASLENPRVERSPTGQVLWQISFQSFHSLHSCFRNTYYVGLEPAELACFFHSSLLLETGQRGPRDRWLLQRARWREAPGLESRKQR